jgi:hypothetical protein
MKLILPEKVCLINLTKRHSVYHCCQNIYQQLGFQGETFIEFKGDVELTKKMKS